MKLTRASSYALHAVAFMAQQKNDKPVASHNIAPARGIPERFLLKVLKPLVSAHVLRSIKGPNGGYKLARPPADISMLEILEAVDGPIRGQAPFAEENNAVLNGKLENICRQTADATRKYLEKVRMSELASNKKEPGREQAQEQQGIRLIQRCGRSRDVGRHLPAGLCFCPGSKLRKLFSMDRPLNGEGFGTPLPTRTFIERRNKSCGASCSVWRHACSAWP